MIDPYFVLRVALEQYILEKKAWMSRLHDLFVSHSKLGHVDPRESQAESDPNAFYSHTELNFEEFRRFMREGFKGPSSRPGSQKFSNEEILKLYRMAWNFGNGKVEFGSFVSALRETNLVLKLLSLQNSSSLALVHETSRVDEQSHILQSKDIIKINLQDTL